jgi:hypothetical protein
MSSKIVNVSTSEIKKSFTAGATTRISQRNKADFKLKRFTGAKSEFGVSALCAGTVFGLSGLKD